MCPERKNDVNFLASVLFGTLMTLGLTFVMIGLGANGWLGTGLGILVWPVVCILFYGLFIELDKKNGR